MAASLVFRLHDGGPQLVREVLLERGWKEYHKGEQEEQDWNLYWRVSTFCNSEYHNLLPWQRLNHHPKTAGITRKDCLARNLRRMRATFGSAIYDFSPTAFILPNDFIRYLAEYNKRRLTGGPPVHWICKPADQSRGRGIFLFEDIRDLVYDCSVIVQRYISNPLLVSGYKFDLRVYVCVKSFHPLTVYVHQEGLVRFATEKYSLSSLHNLYAHLTNTSINKFGPFYKTAKERVGQGCKWTMSKFRHFLHSQDIDEPLLWQRINNIVTLTLLAIAPTVPSCPNCVELFGFDVLVDMEFKPWLLEVNYSPALTLDCQADITVKKRLVSDLIDLMNYTATDSLREKAYQKHRHKQTGVHAGKHSHVAARGISKPKEATSQKKTSASQALQSPALPLLQNRHRSEQIKRGQSERCAFVAEYQRRLPPVDSNKTYAARGRIMNGTGTRKHETLNLILGSVSRTNVSVTDRRTRSAFARWLTNRSVQVSEVTSHDAGETEAETGLAAEADVSCLTADSPQSGLEVRRPAAPWKLPNVYRGSHKPVRCPLEEATAASRQPVPPLRVGDFIRTFPFNTATLKASQHKLDVKVVIQEIHKLTAAVASGKKEVQEDKEAEDNFDSLLWGPKDPPLLSQSFRPT